MNVSGPKPDALPGCATLRSPIGYGLWEFPYPKAIGTSREQTNLNATDGNKSPTGITTRDGEYND